MPSPVCHCANGYVYSHIPRRNQLPRGKKCSFLLSESRNGVNKSIEVTSSRLFFAHLYIWPAFLWKAGVCQPPPTINEPASHLQLHLTEDEYFSMHNNSPQTIAGLSASSWTASSLIREFTLNTAFLKLFLWPGHSGKAHAYLVIKESNHDKEILKKPGFITSTADDATSKSRGKKENIGTSSDGVSNTHLEIYCPE